MTDNWARGILKSMDWVKRKGTTGKLEPSAQFLAEEKFIFQGAILTVVYNHDIPSDLVINLDQTLLSYISPGKYTFNFKGAENVPIKGVDDKRGITATFAISATGKFLPMQLIYPGKTKRCLPNFQFPSIPRLPTHKTIGPIVQTKAIEHFEKVIFPYLEKIKVQKGYPKEQMSLFIMDTFKGKDNNEMRKFCTKKFVKLSLFLTT